MIEQLPKRDSAPAFLLDSHHTNAYGGTGKVGNWQLAVHIARKHPIFLAGGLNLKNISSAIEHVQPWGVDVASGVERARGEKDPALIETFIQAVRELDQFGVITER
jgi:phosphoribosylanthranilate isomerase